MHCAIHSLSNTIYDAEVKSVTLPSEDGQIGILPHHVPLVTALQKGTVIIQGSSSEEKIEIDGGFAYTDGKNLIVFAN